MALLYLLILSAGVVASLPLELTPARDLMRVQREADSGSMVLVSTQGGEGVPTANRRQDVVDVDVPAGEAVDIFYR